MPRVRTAPLPVFLPVYLEQVIEVGYGNAPFERDARAHELRDA